MAGPNPDFVNRMTNPDTDYWQAAGGRLGQVGALLFAAGQKQDNAQRATLLANLPQYMGSLQPELDAMTNNRVKNLQLTAAQDKMAGQQRLLERLKDPAFAKTLGVDPSLLSDLDPETASEIIKTKALADPLDHQIKLAQLQSKNKGEFTKIGTNALGEDLFGWVNPDGTVKPYNSSGDGSSMPSLTDVSKEMDGKTGADAIAIIKKYYPSLASEVEGIAAGRQPFPTRKLGTPQGAVLTSLVSMVDPAYDASTFTARQKHVSDLAAGGPSSDKAILTNLKTSVDHFSELYKLADKIPDIGKTGELGLAATNYLTNRGTSGTPEEREAIKKFDQVVEIGGDEMAKFLGIDAEKGREKVKEIFRTSQGRTALKSLIKQQISLAKDKLNNLDSNHKRIMGPLGGSLIDEDFKKKLAPFEENEKNQPEKSPFPDYPNAQKASDGNWYVTINGQRYKVDP